jgi:large subunit ribosomal protein L33
MPLMAGKGNRVIIRLVSEAGTGTAYSTTKNKRNRPEKLKLKKYDAKLRRRVFFVEAK